jgi:hypothetical protein
VDAPVPLGFVPRLMPVEVPACVPMALVLPGMGVGPPQATSKEAAAPQAHKLLVRLNIFGPVMLTSLSMRAVNRVTPKVPPPDT